MNDRDALLRAISDHPGEDTPRLMYADWLEEHAQPERAEFVRMQIELDRMDLDDPDRTPLVRRHARFLHEHVPDWKAELPHIPGIEWGDFHRGFVEEVQAPHEGPVLQHAAAIFAEPAVHVLRLSRLYSGRAFAALPELARVRVLRMISASAQEGTLGNLLVSPHLTHLTALDLHGNAAGNGGAAALAGGAFPALEEVWLGMNGIENAGGQALANSRHLPRLRLLDLRGNRITDPAVRAALTRRFGAALKI